jgi:hypothetical protein
VAFSRTKQFKDIEFSYDAPSGFTLKFYTDMPGSTMTERASLSFPSSTGRRTYTLPLVDGAGAHLEGTLYRVKITSTGVVRLFGGVLRARAIGVYLDGAAAETFETQEQGIGI